jgi:hypothetical protein
MAFNCERGARRHAGRHVDWGGVGVVPILQQCVVKIFALREMPIKAAGGHVQSLGERLDLYIGYAG